MRNKISFTIEYLMVITFFVLFIVKNTGLMTERWLVVFTPIFVIGAMRSFIVLLVGIYNTNNMIRWIKYKFTGVKPEPKKKTVKVKIKRNNRKGRR